MAAELGVSQRTVGTTGIRKSDGCWPIARIASPRPAKLAERGVGAAVLLGPTRAHVLAIALLGELHSLSYSRDVESRADLTGSDICAAAGYNPWGLVWLFRDFDAADVGQVPQLLSDHPSNQNRVDVLEQHFRNDPSVFGKFKPDSKSAARFVALERAPEVFLR